MRDVGFLQGDLLHLHGLAGRMWQRAGVIAKSGERETNESMARRGPVSADEQARLLDDGTTVMGDFAHTGENERPLMRCESKA
jgi:hypothetical protein